MLLSIKKLVLPLMSAGLISLLGLAPASAQGAYPGYPSSPMAGPSTGGAPYAAPRSVAVPGYRYAPAANARYGDGDNDADDAGSVYNGAYPIRYYRVVFGDTLLRIAARFGVSERALLAANPSIRNPNLIFAGRTLAIPSSAGAAYSASGGYLAPSYVAPGSAMGSYRAPGSSMGSGGYATPATPAPTPQATPMPGSTPTPGRQTVNVNLSASNMAFDQSTLAVPAGAHVIVHFNNTDPMPHNLAVYTDSSARQVIFRGQILMGPNTSTYEFDAPSQPGTHFFRCDVHPTLMTGQFIVQ